MRQVCATFVMALTLAVAAQAGQTPDAAARQAAEDKAAQERMTKMAADQAEAVERARRKVAEEAAEKAKAEVIARQREFERVTTVDIEVVISRFQGDKKVSSLPYALTVNAIAGVRPLSDAPLTQLRMGGQVPMPMMNQPAGADGKPAFGPVQYRDVGTQIDCRARGLDDGRFEVFVNVEDSAVATPQGATDSNSLPVIRTFRSANNLVLRDGQTRQFTAAADRITGEIVRVDVTLKVAK